MISQYHLYYTDLVSESNLYSHCLYYKVFENVYGYDENESFNLNLYQLIPYCIRSFVNKTEEVNGNILSKFTFEQLQQQQAKTQDLLSWSAPVDLVERYQTYLNTLNVSLIKNEPFYNCSLSWFGPSCQYTFNSIESFNKILYKTSYTSIEMTNLF